MARYYQREEIDGEGYLPLRALLAIGRFSKSGKAPKEINRSDKADLCLLESEDQRIREIGADVCQLFISRRSGSYFAEDLNPDGNSCSVAGELFTRRKLLINDRISVGDKFHFLFDGLGLKRIPEKTGGRLVAKNLNKFYTKGHWPQRKTEVVAVRNISFEILPNDFVGILGPSGCGKSTLLSMLSGSLRPSTGCVEINGVDLYRDPTLVRSMIGIVPQDDIVHRELTVEEAVAMSARLRLGSRIPRRSKEELASQVISDLGLGERARNRISELSGGQRKRASIAVEILKQTQVLFLDEPSSGLDPATEEDLMFQLRHLADQGRTILCTTHVLDRAFLFSKIIFLARGGLVFEGTVDEALAFFGVRSLLDAYRQLDNPGRSALDNGDGSTNFYFSSPDDETREDTPDSLQTIWFEKGCVVRLRGKLDNATLDSLKVMTRRVNDNLVIDFSDIDDENYDGGRFLRGLVQIMSKRRCSLSIAACGGKLADCIKENRYERLMKLYPDAKSAVVDRRIGARKGADEANGLFGGSPTLLVVLAIAVIAIFAAFSAIIILILRAGNLP